MGAGRSRSSSKSFRLRALRTLDFDELGGFGDDGNLPLNFLGIGRQYATLRTFRDHGDYPNGRFITVDLDTGEVVAVAFAEDVGIPEADPILD